MKRSNRAARALAFTLTLSMLVASTTGCQKVADAIRGAANALAPPLKDVSDVGVISELGWLSKLLRDSAQGDEAQRKKAHTAIVRLFGLTDQELSQNGGLLSLAVTLEFSGATVDPRKPLQFQLRYTGSADEKTMAELYAKGNGWSPIDLVDEPMYRMSAPQLNALIESQMSELPIACRQLPSMALVSVQCDTTSIPDFGKTGMVRPAQAKPTENVLHQQVKSALREFGKQLAVSSKTPALLPPEGSLLRYTANFGYGETNLLPYAVVFMPVEQVKNYPNIKVKAWLHLTTDATKMLGQRRPILATDFAERCTGRAGQNPTPAVDSKTSAGPLCWYAFDLLGDGQRGNLAMVRAEINELAKK